MFEFLTMIVIVPPVSGLLIPIILLSHLNLPSLTAHQLPSILVVRTHAFGLDGPSRRADRSGFVVLSTLRPIGRALSIFARRSLVTPT